jgi:AraC family transcriptional regulator of adaptative response / DNA-3-methyladenine glycosylase II
VRLAYRPPNDVAAMLGFFGQRASRGVELVSRSGAGGGLARTLAIEAAGRIRRGWLAADFDPTRHQVLLRVGDSLLEVLPVVIRRVRDALDLDADPRGINKLLDGPFPGGDGLRVPGTLSGYEVAGRAVLGQQITVAAARTLAQRLVDRFGESIATPWPELTRLFPEPAVLARAEGDALGQLGIVKQRQAAIVAIARAIDSRQVSLHAGADVQAAVQALTQLPGIGDWTAQYIAMRALRGPDAFPAGDVALHKALGVQDEPRPARAALAASQAWRPWRSYAVIRAWHGLAARAAPAATATDRSSIIQAPPARAPRAAREVL